MKISYWWHGNTDVASARMRILLPAMELKQSHEILHNDTAGDVHYFCKHESKRDRDLIETPIVSVYDVCDNHFGGRYDYHYRHMCEYATRVVCNTKAMQLIIKEETGRDSTVIPDPYEYAEFPVRPIMDSLNYIWFGYGYNIVHMGNIAVPNLRVVSNVSGTDTHNIKFIPWSHDNLINNAEQCHVSLLPQSNEYKSANRLINSLRLGLFPIASPIESYKEFSDFAYIGDVAEGIQWAEKNKDSLKSKIRMGQDYINDKYSPREIAKLWDRQFNYMSDDNELVQY